MSSSWPSFSQRLPQCPIPTTAIERTSEISYPYIKLPTMPEDNQSQGLFIQAARCGDIETLGRSLESGFDINTKVVGEDGPKCPIRVALVEVSRYGHENAVKFLLDHGADVNNTEDTLGHDSASVLLVSCRRGDVDIVKLLIAYGAKVGEVGIYNHSNTMSACLPPAYMKEEISKSHRGIIEILLNSGYDINSQDDDGESPLTVAVELGDKALIQLLLNRGANIDRRAHGGSGGKCALDEAACDGRTDLMQLLLDRGAALEHPTRSCTVLQVAAKENRLDTLKYLLRAGADSEAAKANMISALSAAASSGGTDAIKLLLDADINNGAKPPRIARNTDSTPTSCLLAPFICGQDLA